MRDTDKQVAQQFAQFANVVEAWPLYDSIVISKTFYGNEIGQDGWFTSWANFGNQETHRFFNIRTESAGDAYCNMQSADTMDFAFMAHSIGIAIQAPAPNVEGHAQTVQEGQAGELGGNDSFLPHWIASELPNHMGLQLKVQQDIRIELPTMGCPAGYGALGSGTATDYASAAVYGEIPIHENAVVQGVPVLENRVPFPTPIGIPRTASIEGILHVSEYARNVLQSVKGPDDYQFNTDDGAPPYSFFQKRYVIQLSLFGERMVQQRGQYHR